MCEFCGGDCKLCDGREWMTKQPLNEAYGNELLEAYQKISDTFDDFTQLMRKRVPYEQWPEHCKAVAGVNPELGGFTGEHVQVKVNPIEPRHDDLTNHCDDAIAELEKALEEGWLRCQSNCRPDESFRAMIKIISNWKTCIQRQKKSEDIWDILKSRGIDPTKAFPMAMISRLEDIGRAQAKLKMILDHELLEDLSKHNTYWHSKHELEAEKLHDLRAQISCLNENLWDLWTILRKEEE